MTLTDFYIEGNSGAVLKVEIAESFAGRFLGLMGRKKIPSGQGLLLSPCNSIHMCFMRFSIDAVYLDKDFRIKKIVENLKPWIGISMCLGAQATLELPAGDANKFGLKVGQQLLRSSP